MLPNIKYHRYHISVDTQRQRGNSLQGLAPGRMSIYSKYWSLLDQLKLALS
jgi:hypothetical protein